MSLVLEYGRLKLLETSGPVQDCYGIAVPLPVVYEIRNYMLLRVCCMAKIVRYFVVMESEVIP